MKNGLITYEIVSNYRGFWNLKRRLKDRYNIEIEKSLLLKRIRDVRD